MERYAALRTLALDEGLIVAPLRVEASFRRGLFKIQFTGLGRSQAHELGDRMRAALHNIGVRLPPANLVVSVFPADLARRGGLHELALVAAVLLALETPPPDSPLARCNLERTVFAGEISLSGALLPVRGLGPILFAARNFGFDAAFVPAAQAGDFSLAEDMDILPLASLTELRRAAPVAATARVRSNQWRGVRVAAENDPIEAPARALRAIAAAAAGWHSTLFVGPPGAGKSSLARDLISLLAPPDAEERREILATAGLAQLRPAAGVIEVQRPVRSPHHSCTRRALLGGGQPLTVGEITRAHRGVLFLDEMAEFARDALQGLREPMERGYVDISRGRDERRLPARFLLIGATNPCACGRFGSRTRGPCVCSPVGVQHYALRILGPLQDRIEIEIDLGVDPHETRLAMSVAELSALVDRAAEHQRRRYAGENLRWNSDLDFETLERFCPLTTAGANRAWRKIRDRQDRSLRGLASVRRIARTLADLENCEQIEERHLLEAQSYRCVERVLKRDM